jgi:PPOX class probable F420-dependent enzyme
MRWPLKLIRQSISLARAQNAHTAIVHDDEPSLLQKRTRIMGRSRATLTEREKIFIARQRVARLATSDTAGHPTAVPVCYACDGSRFFIALDEKPKSVDARQLKRVRNIEARHEAALLIDQYTDDWSQLAYILIHGQAEIIPPGHPLHTQALTLVRERYVQYHTMKLEELPVIMITPERISSWGPGLEE